MTKRINNRKDIMLLLLYSPGRGEQPNESIVGRTRLVKMLFLFKEEAMQHFKAELDIPADKFYQFFAWNFGPFSRDVYDDLTFFTLRGFVKSAEVEEDALPESAAEWEAWLDCAKSAAEEEYISEFKEESFSLTTKGVAFAAELYENLSPPQRKLLKEFKKRTCAVPLRALLKYVYENYEQMTEKSTIKEEILGNG
jgi:hypothetical protein